MKNSTSKDIILIVDDVPDNIQVLCNILYQQGINIVIAQSGKEALDIVARTMPDLMLLDILMPDIDGFAVCKQVKENPATADVPIIFLTGKTAPEDIVKGFECGAVDYVTKPFHPAELLSRVLTHLELKKARDLISEQNHLLAEQNATLQDLNATRDKFFSIIAHDLRNPFTQLVLLSEFLQDELQKVSISAHAEKYLHHIQSASAQGAELLENLLEWSHSQTGKMTFKPQRVPLKSFVKATLSVLAHQAHSKSITLRYDIADQLFVWADTNMLATVIRNLVSNAIKFTEPGGKVSIMAEQREKMMNIFITDTGIGIQEHDLNKLFRIDIHHSTSGTDNEKGTGLGLILCKEFVEKHEGTIGVTSEIGRGSSFFFTLPTSPCETCGRHLS